MQFLPDPAGWFGVKDGEDSVRQSSSAALSIPSDTKRTRNVVDDVQKYQGRPTCLRSRVGSHKASEIHHAAPLLGAQPAIGPYCDVLALYRNLHLNDYVYAVSDTVGDASMASWIARGGGEFRGRKYTRGRCGLWRRLRQCLVTCRSEKHVLVFHFVTG
jgi:hypothetical protein